MLTVMELLNHPLFKDFRLVNDPIGLQTPVRGTGILEWEQAKEIQQNFHKGDFVITTLSPYRNNKPQAEFFLKLLMDTDPAAIAIKNVYFRDVSDDIIDYANFRKIPIFFFEDTYFDDIIFTIKNSLNKGEINSTSVQLMRRILYEDIPPFTIETLAKEINRFLGDQHICAFIMPPSYRSEKNEELMNTLRQNKLDAYVQSKFKKPEEAVFSIIEFPASVGIIYSTFDPNLNLEEEMKAFLDTIGLTDIDVHIGIGEAKQSLTKLNLSFREAIYSSVEAKYQNRPLMHFREIGLSQFLCPLRNDYWVKNYFDQKINILKNHDMDHNLHLIETAKAFIKNDCNFAETSKSIFQHSNTVRYRINKIYQLLGLDESVDASGQLALILKQDEINNILYHAKI